MNSIPHLFSIARIGGFLLVNKLFSLLSITYAIGTFKTLFSLSNIAGPLVGSFSGAFGTFTFFTSNLLWALFFKKSIVYSSLAFSGIPTLCASLYWTRVPLFVRAGIPALCIILFMIHPIGMYALPYALFWLVPLIIALHKKQLLFFTALGSTFTAHAVGSVLWLYATAMPVDQWYALMPIVPVERLLFAAGMTLLYSLFSRITVSQPVPSPSLNLK